MKIYFPTMYGDLSLEKKDEKTTVLKTTKLSVAEVNAIKMIFKKFDVDKSIGQGDSDAEITISAPFKKVHKAFVKTLKAGSEVVTVVKLSDGKLQEVRDVNLKELEDKEAVTTAIPSRGCPAILVTPTEREIRASGLLKKFLNPVQVEDFEMAGAFVAIGGDSGHRYRIAHRYSMVNADGEDFNFVKDLDTGRFYCNEHTNLPPSEEVLAIYVAISCREKGWINS